MENMNMVAAMSVETDNGSATLSTNYDYHSKHYCFKVAGLYNDESIFYEYKGKTDDLEKAIEAFVGHVFVIGNAFPTKLVSCFFRELAKEKYQVIMFANHSINQHYAQERVLALTQGR